jgi:uncharacterized membrane protein
VANRLLLLGGIVLGANMAILSQLFHISGSSYVLFMSWSIGVTIMAYSLRLTSLSVMAIALMGYGYWLAAFTGIGIGDRQVVAPVWTSWLVDYMPICAPILFLPLAYRCRSAVIFLLTAIAWLSSYQFGAFRYAFYAFPGTNGLSVDRVGLVLGCTIPPLLLWAYGRIQEYLIPHSYALKISIFSHRLAIFSGVLTCFTLSWPGMMYILVGDTFSKSTYSNGWLTLTALFLPIAVVGWLWLWKLTSRWQLADLYVGGFNLAGVDRLLSAKLDFI